MAALAEDEDLARRVVAAEGDDDEDRAPTPPKFSEWSPEMYALATLQDQMTALIAATVAAAGGKPGQSQPVDRPVPALRRMRLERDEAQVMTVVDRLRGNELAETEAAAVDAPTDRARETPPDPT